MTPEERKALIKQIAEVGGGSDNLLMLLKNLDEDIENANAAVENYEPIPDGFESWGSALESARGETAAANKRYIDRFFDGDSSTEKVTHHDPDGDENKLVIVANAEDNKRMDYADLFETKSKEEK